MKSSVFIQISLGFTLTIVITVVAYIIVIHKTPNESESEAAEQRCPLSANANTNARSTLVAIQALFDLSAIRCGATAAWTTVALRQPLRQDWRRFGVSRCAG
uniref:(northern house mosquito) hypothetical protein n=1 Tax=Culex pipiens TaxID=7175 RepID=A0A8D8AY87_CULPI